MRDHVNTKEILLIGVERAARDKGKQKHSRYPRHGSTRWPLVAAQPKPANAQQIGHNRRRSHDQPQQAWLELREEGGQRELWRQLLPGEQLGRGVAHQLGWVDRWGGSAEPSGEAHGNRHDRQLNANDSPERVWLGGQCGNQFASVKRTDHAKHGDCA